MVFLLLDWMWRGAIVPGYVTTILFIVTMNAAILIGVGLASEYIHRILKEVRNRPRYLIAKTHLPDQPISKS